MQNEVYISTFTDNVPIGSINSYAKIMSPEVYTSKYPKGVPRKSKDYGKTFICRRGCEYLRGVFTPDFRWEERYRYDEESMQKLSEWIDSNTKVKKTRKRKFGDVRDEDDKEFVVGRDMDQDDAVLKTPRKKQKTSAASTPQKLRTPSKLFTPSHKRYATGLIQALIYAAKVSQSRNQEAFGNHALRNANIISKSCLRFAFPSCPIETPCLVRT